MVKVKFGKDRVTLDKDGWRGNNPELVHFLNQVTTEEDLLGTPGNPDPLPDIAKQVAHDYGGKVTKVAHEVVEQEDIKY